MCLARGNEILGPPTVPNTKLETRHSVSRSDVPRIGEKRLAWIKFQEYIDYVGEIPRRKFSYMSLNIYRHVCLACLPSEREHDVGGPPGANCQLL